jgi:NADPH2:quinone reductase
VIEGPSSVRGLAVWGTGGDIGYTRDGTHAEMIDIPLEAVSEKPGNLSPEEAAVVGVPYSTAFTALENTRLSAGEWVIVTGAAGAVGSAAVELVHARGAYSIGLVRNAQERESVDPKMVSAVASTEAGDLEEVVRKATGGKGADVALNGIGASVAPAILSSLNHGGRMAVYSVAFGGRDMQLDLFALYRKRLEIMGVDTASFGVVGGAAILNQLKPLFEKGLLDRPKIAAKYALDDFAAAYARVRQGGGKIVFTMNPTAS